MVGPVGRPAVFASAVTLCILLSNVSAQHDDDDTSFSDDDLQDAQMPAPICETIPDCPRGYRDVAITSSDHGYVNGWLEGSFSVANLGTNATGSVSLSVSTPEFVLDSWLLDPLEPDANHTFTWQGPTPRDAYFNQPFDRIVIRAVAWHPDEFDTTNDMVVILLENRPRPASSEPVECEASITAIDLHAVSRDRVEVEVHVRDDGDSNGARVGVAIVYGAAGQAFRQAVASDPLPAVGTTAVQATFDRLPDSHATVGAHLLHPCGTPDRVFERWGPQPEWRVEENGLVILDGGFVPESSADTPLHREVRLENHGAQTLAPTALKMQVWRDGEMVAESEAKLRKLAPWGSMDIFMPAVNLDHGMVEIALQVGGTVIWSHESIEAKNTLWPLLGLRDLTDVDVDYGFGPGGGPA